MANATSKEHRAEAFVGATEAVHVAAAIAQSGAGSPDAAAQPPRMQKYRLGEMTENGSSDSGRHFGGETRAVLVVAVKEQSSTKDGPKLQVRHRTSPVNHVPKYY